MACSCSTTPFSALSFSPPLRFRFCRSDFRGSGSVICRYVRSGAKGGRRPSFETLTLRKWSSSRPRGGTVPSDPESFPWHRPQQLDKAENAEKDEACSPVAGTSDSEASINSAESRGAALPLARLTPPWLHGPTSVPSRIIRKQMQEEVACMEIAEQSSVVTSGHSSRVGSLRSNGKKAVHFVVKDSNSDAEGFSTMTCNPEPVADASRHREANMSLGRGNCYENPARDAYLTRDPSGRLCENPVRGIVGRSNKLTYSISSSRKSFVRSSKTDTMQHQVMPNTSNLKEHGRKSSNIVVVDRFGHSRNTIHEKKDYKIADADNFWMDADSIVSSLESVEENPSKDGRISRSNTELAEKSIPEPELRRLRADAAKMKERMKVGAAGVTQAVVESIHKKWETEEVVVMRFEGPPSLNMKRVHEILENKTGGIVIWRSGRSLVIYRGMSYNLQCIQTCAAKLAQPSGPEKPDMAIAPAVYVGEVQSMTHSRVNYGIPSISCGSLCMSAETSEIEELLHQLGPPFIDWSGCRPFPVDADLLPAIVPGYTPPFRLLPYKTRRTLSNGQMTSLRRISRKMPPHFALGRNRQLQGLASAIVKLWEKSAIAKIAIKRGVLNTCNDRMAEEIKKSTGGVLLSRNKEYIVLYRGNDFITPIVRNVLVEKQQLADDQQDEEEAARSRDCALTTLSLKVSSQPLVAGTLAETLEAESRWNNTLNTEERQMVRKDISRGKHASLLRLLERKLYFARKKVAKAEKALSKVQEFLIPSELPTDLETVTDEERSLFRRIGLKMKPFVLLGRRDVFDGTVQNMHFHWKHRELVKIFVKGKNFAQVKHIAVALEAESGGVLISLDKTTKGYAIVVYRGKNYQRPKVLRPQNLLTRRQALARSIELQRREALKRYISNLQHRIQMLILQQEQMKDGNFAEDATVELQIKNALLLDDDSGASFEDEGEEAYLETYNSGDESENTSPEDEK